MSETYRLKNECFENLYNKEKFLLLNVLNDLSTLSIHCSMYSMI